MRRVLLCGVGSLLALTLAGCGGGGGGDGGGGGGGEQGGVIGQVFAETSPARSHAAAASASLELGDQAGEDLTIEFWMYVAAMPAVGYLDTIVTDDGYAVQVGSPTSTSWGLRLVLWHRSGKELQDWFYYTSPPIGVWTHVAFQIQQSTGRVDVAVNGVLQTGSTGSGPKILLAGAQPFHLGGNPSYVPDLHVFKGRIDCLRISDTIRYGASFVPPVAGVDLEPASDAHTRALWLFNQGPPYQDSSGNGNTLEP